MTGPEHYVRAEELLGYFYLTDSRRRPNPAPLPANVAKAQVHATLALAAAIGTSADVPDAREWRKAAGPDPGA